MLIALISDIHGNLAALDAVLADARARGADVVANLGDILSGPLQPAESADRLIALGLPTIRGNHERQLLEDAPERLGESDAFTAARLTAAHRAWLAGLPTTMWLADGVFACHGSPCSDLEYCLETVTPEGARAATDGEVAERLGAIAAPVIVCGHTHMPRLRRLPDGRMVVNPGSVGLPAIGDVHPHPHALEAGSPHARYALLRQQDGGWEAELVQVTYDWDSAARLAEARGRMDWAVPLRTGFT